ncbi:MerR family transcriptional regulator [Arcanobacterium hippocoleae]
MDMNETLYTVGEVAQMLDITVRTLHHWESQGLVNPVERSWSNYRLYAPKDVQRLQQILIYRATGMRLSDIKNLLNFDSSSLEHLRRQREILVDQQAQISAMVEAIDKLMEKEMNNETLTHDQIGEILGDAKFSEYQAEAEELYGGTDDWKLSKQRISSWGSTDWAGNKQRFEDINARLAEAIQNGVKPDSQEASGLVLVHREVLSEFFPVTPAKHYLISRSYIADERFRNYYDNYQEGLARWLADAIAYVAAQSGVDLNNPVWE